MNLTPFFSLVGAFFFIGEKIALAHILGFVLILIGVLLGSGTLEGWIYTTKQKRKVVYERKVKSS